jgi:subtilisin family serine protease
MLVIFCLVAASLPLLVSSAGADRAESAGEAHLFVVLYADGASLAEGRAAVTATGGTIRTENAAIGLAEVSSTNPEFLRQVRTQHAVKGAARDQSVATVRPGMGHKFADERLDEERAAAVPHSGGPAVRPTPGTDPLTGYQWDMEMIGAQDEDGSPALEAQGDGVLVGIIDTGIDGSHPDIAPNFSNALSRNFTVDLPVIDGPCEYADCVDPANVDQDGHGTHVAGTVASPVNGVGISGVAPEATLVNVRAGQDSGYFSFPSRQK